MMQETLNKQIVITAILLVAVILFFDFTNVDRFVQDLFYNFETNSWIVSVDDDKVAKFIFYDGFKKLFKVFYLLTIIFLILSFFKRFPILHSYRKNILIFGLSLLLVPSLAGLKSVTNMPCPDEIIEYGGKYQNVRLFGSYPEDNTPLKRVKCYPAGHAVLGFSLMALYFLFKIKRNKNIALGVGITIGVLTGGYKMLIGHHFLSHTLVTMIGAWLIILIVTKIVNKIKKLED
ncbi:phosphatase PAP2 family protein [Aliarcobacter lanthieri]|uniref:phosphatase PAP2 family protein n=1 Tax=Aliarcobacter lanthieri TaxID=1355374 RepID=UPI003AFAD9D9